MFCKHCGKELADDAFMCPNCGSPTSLATLKQEPQKDPEAIKKAPAFTGLSVVGFVLAMIALVTGVVFGAFLFVFPMARLLLFILGASTVLPALAGISIGTYLLCAGRNALTNSAKALSVVAIVFSAVVILFLFIGGSMLVTVENYDYMPYAIM